MAIIFTLIWHELIFTPTDPVSRRHPRTSPPPFFPPEFQRKVSNCFRTSPACLRVFWKCYQFSRQIFTQFVTNDPLYWEVHTHPHTHTPPTHPHPSPHTHTPNPKILHLMTLFSTKSYTERSTPSLRFCSKFTTATAASGRCWTTLVGSRAALSKLQKHQISRPWWWWWWWWWWQCSKHINAW